MSVLTVFLVVLEIMVMGYWLSICCPVPGKSEIKNFYFDTLSVRTNWLGIVYFHTNQKSSFNFWLEVSIGERVKKRKTTIKIVKES